MPRYVHSDGSAVDLALDGRIVHDSAAGASTHQNPGTAREAYLARVHELARDGFALEDDPDAGDDREERAQLLQRLTRHPELEAAIAATPDDSGPYQVFADFLQSNNDPWGTLIALQVAGKQESADAFLDRNADALLGDLAGLYRGRDLELEWRWGFIRRAHLRATLDTAHRLTAVLRQLLAHRLAPRIDALDLDASNPTPLAELVLASAHARQLRELVLNGNRHHVDARPFATGFPVLERLELVNVPIDLSLAMPRLRHLRIWEAQIERLAPGKAPALARVDLPTFGATRDVRDDLPRVFAVLAAAAPALDTLGLAVFDDDWAHDVLGVLAGAPFVGRVRQLGLQFTRMQPTAAAFQGHGTLLARFESVHLLGRRPLQRSRAAIEALVPNVRFGR